MPSLWFFGRMSAHTYQSRKNEPRIGARLLEPRRVDRRVVDDQVDEHADAERLGVLHERDEVAERPMLVVDAVEVGNVVAVVAIRGWVERLEPHAGHAEALEVVEAPHQAFEVADAVAIGVLILLDVEAVDDRVLVPEVVDGHSLRSYARAVTRRGSSRLSALSC